MGDAVRSGRAERRWPAKICRPAVLNALSRDRLFRQLDKGRGCSVVWVSGPAGCGKTTLVSSYVETRKVPCLWYRVDEGDADLPTFFHYLGLAAQQINPNRRKRLPHLTSEYLHGIPEFSRNFFSELFVRLPSSALLVLDGCQAVPESAPLHSALLDGLNRTPEGLCLILVSRVEPPPPFARLRANRSMDVVCWRDLRLSLAEFEAILELEGVRALPAETVAQLHERMGGWAAGLQLVLEAARTGDFDFGSVERGTPDEVFDYFGGEIFARLDEETRDFLLRTSFLPSMTARIARELTGYSAADRFLSILHRHNHFTEKRLSDEAEYQYHPLFRAFLNERARERLSSEESAAVQRRAAALLAGTGRTEEAASLLRDAADWDGLTELILSRAEPFLAQGRRQVIESWLREFPMRIVEQTPWLLYWLGECRMPLDPEEARDLFERAYRGFDADGRDEAGLLLSWSGAVDSILRGLEDYADLDPWIATVSDAFGSPHAFSAALGSRVTSAMYAALAVRRPGHPDFGWWEARALETARETPNADLAVQILTHAAFNKCYHGDLPGAESVLAEARRIAGGKRVGPLSRIRALFAEAFFRNAAGCFQRVSELTREALELADVTGVHVMDFMILSNGARAALNADELPEARALLEELAAVPIPPKRWTRCFQEYLHGALALREGDLERASRCADLALEEAASAGVCYAEAASRLLKAEVLQERGESDRAAAQLAEGEALAVENGYVQLQLNAGFAAARLALARDGEGVGAAALRAAMVLGSQSGGVVPYLCRAPALAELCATALRRGVEVKYAQALAAGCALASGAPDPENEDWPWPVKIYTLGRFEVRLRGVPLRSSGKVQKKPLMLLKALVAFGGRAVSESRLTEALWPDSDGAMAHTSFSSTLHRLRLLLGDREALEVRDGALGLDPKRCWVDVWALERFLRNGQSAAGEAGSTPEGFERAIALYGGSFLPQEADAYWTIAPRERLRGQFVRAVATHGRSLETAERWDEAAATYQRATEVDPLAEELHRHLILCHERLGRRAEALAAYERCRRVLRRALGVEPSPQTEALGLRLRME